MKSLIFLFSESFTQLIPESENYLSNVDLPEIAAKDPWYEQYEDLIKD